LRWIDHNSLIAMPLDEATRVVGIGFVVNDARRFGKLMFVSYNLFVTGKVIASSGGCSEAPKA
jgi:hypothetical protein